MNNFIFILLQVLSVFLAVGVSYVFRKIRKDRIDLNTLTELIIYIGSPCLVFSKIATAQYNWSELSFLSGAMVFFIFGVAGLNYLFKLIFKFKTGNVFNISTMFMNTANIGFPVTLFVLGPIAFQKAIILDLTMIIILFSVGVGMMSKNYMELLKMPVIYAAIVAFFFSFSRSVVPEQLLKPLELLGDITVPAMIISLGCKLADLKIKVKDLKLPIIATLIRSVGGFVLGLIFIKIFNLTGLTRNVILLYSALPAPVMTYILAQKYHDDENYAAQIVLISNLSAIIILPVVIYLFMYVL